MTRAEAIRMIREARGETEAQFAAITEIKLETLVALEAGAIPLTHDEAMAIIRRRPVGLQYKIDQAVLFAGVVQRRGASIVGMPETIEGQVIGLALDAIPQSDRRLEALRELLNKLKELRESAPAK